MALSMKSSRQFHLDTSCAKLTRSPGIQRYRMRTHDSKLSTGNITVSRSELSRLFSSKRTQFQNPVRSSLSDDMAGDNDESTGDENQPVEENPPVEEIRPVEETQAMEETQPVEEIRPVEETQAMEETQPVEESPVVAEAASEEIKEEVKETEEVVPVETTESTTKDEPETAPAVASVGCPEGFTLNFLWFKSSLAIAVDQIFSKDQRSPLTDYYVWPRSDAWEDLRKSLNENNWISESDQVCLLNRVTEVINYWQEGNNGHTLEEARTAFPDCVFMGS